MAFGGEDFYKKTVIFWLAKIHEKKKPVRDRQKNIEERFYDKKNRPEIYYPNIVLCQKYYNSVFNSIKAGYGRI